MKGVNEMAEGTVRDQVSLGDVEALIAELEAELAVVDKVMPVVDTDVVICPCSCQCTTCTDTTCATHHC